MEYIGHARELRRKVEREHKRFREEAAALLEPFRPRPGFTPMPSRLHLRRLAHQWRRLPANFRLGCRTDVDRNGRLQIAETRLQASKLRLPFWSDDEPGLSIVLLTVAIVPPLYAEADATMVAIGLHALARRFERGEPAEAAVLRDLFPLVQAYPRAVEALAADFPVEVTGGHWRCTIMTEGEGARVLAVRTFIGD